MGAALWGWGGPGGAARAKIRGWTCLPFVKSIKCLGYLFGYVFEMAYINKKCVAGKSRIKNKSTGFMYGSEKYVTFGLFAESNKNNIK